LCTTFGVFVEGDDGTEDRAVELFQLIRAILGAVAVAFGDVEMAFGVSDLLYVLNNTLANIIGKDVRLT
jgi:hypothetical protein